jgi:hypothetical protein
MTKDDILSCQKTETFSCEKCAFTCSRKWMYDRHLDTPKHKKNYNELQESCEKAPPQCHCGKIYKHRQGLWKHQQVCNNKCTDTNDVNLLTNLVLEIVKSNNAIQMQNLELQKQNQEMQKQMLDVCKNGIITNNTNINSNNKTFNLQVFLLENCKDAMNLSEFLESIKIQLADVEAVGELGYINGISKLIIQNLKGLDVTKRPIHCTDEKREIIYIKEAGVWTKDEDNSKLRRLIKTVSNRNFKCTRLYKEKYPDCVTAASRYSDTYNKIVIEATGGGSNCNDFESENKIMKKIAKAITIDKSAFLTNA